MVRKIPAFDADGMDFLDILRNSHETRDRAEWLAHVVSVKPCDNDPFPLVGKLLCDSDKALPEELCLIDSHYLCIIGRLQHLLRILYWRAWDAVEIM